MKQARPVFAHPSTDWCERIAPDEETRFAEYAEHFATLQRQKSELHGQGRALHRKQLVAATAELEVAIRDALVLEVPHPNAVRLTLERRRQKQETPPPIGVSLPDHVRQRDVTVRPHPLAGYDQLTEAHDDDE